MLESGKLKIEIKQMKFDAESHVANWYVQVGEEKAIQFLHNDGSLHPQATDTPSSSGWYASPADAQAAVARFHEKEKR